MRSLLVFYISAVFISMLIGFSAHAADVSYEANVKVTPYGLGAGFSGSIIQSQPDLPLAKVTNSLLGLNKSILGLMLDGANKAAISAMANMQDMWLPLMVPTLYQSWKCAGGYWWGWVYVPKICWPEFQIVWVDTGHKINTGIKKENLTASIASMSFGGVIRGSAVTFPADAFDIVQQKVGPTKIRYTPPYVTGEWYFRTYEKAKEEDVTPTIPVRVAVPLGTLRLALGSPGYSDGGMIASVMVKGRVTPTLLGFDLLPIDCEISATLRNPTIQARYNPITAQVGYVVVGADNIKKDDSGQNDFSDQQIISKPYCDVFGLNALDKLIPQLKLGSALSGYITGLIWGNGKVKDAIKNALSEIPNAISSGVTGASGALKDYSVPSLAVAYIPKEMQLSGLPVGDLVSQGAAQLLLNNAIQATIRPENMTSTPCVTSGKQYVSRALEAKWSNPLLLMGFDLIKRVKMGEQCLGVADPSPSKVTQTYFIPY